MLLLIQSGFMMAQTETVVTPNGKKVTFYPGAPGTANNGLTITTGNIQLGGTLIKPSVLTTSSAFTLAIQGLQTGSVADQIVTTDVNGVLRTIANTSWSTQGNIGTTAGINFIGTTDHQDLVFKRYKDEFGRISKTNISFGRDALLNNTALYCIGIGRFVLKSNSGASNTGLGDSVLSDNTKAAGNTGLGNGALRLNITGNNNTALGSSAIANNTSGNNNIGIGLTALSGNLSGNDNIGIGLAVLGANSGGNKNIALGGNALDVLTTGDNNIAIGYLAGHGNGLLTGNNTTSLNNSIMLGVKAYPMNDNDHNEIVIGNGAVGRGSSTVQIGDTNMISIGGAVDWSITSDVRLKKDIVTSVYGLNFINKLRPVTYKLKTGTTDL